MHLRRYPGSYPIAISADDFRGRDDWSSELALNIATGKADDSDS